MSIEPRRCRQRGVTLIELIMFIVIVSTAVVGVLSVLNITSRHSADPMINKQMLAIAESLMDEVQLKDFDAAASGRSGAACYAGTFDQAHRTSFDCVANYNGFPWGATGIHDAGGNAIPSLADFTANVTVVPAAAAVSGAPAAAILVITVTVTRGTDSLTLTGYRFNYG